MRTVVVIGCGALGSHVAYALRGQSDVTLRLVDHDRVEARNTASQFYAVGAAGRYKAVELGRTIGGLFGAARFLEARPVALRDDNARELLSGAALAVDCTDNAEARLCAQRWGRTLVVPVLHVCLAAQAERFARVAWSDVFVPDEDASGAATCEDGEALPFIVYVAGFAAEQAALALRGRGQGGEWHLTPGSVMWRGK